MKEKALRCACGKLIAYERNGAVYVMCKRCRREVKVAERFRTDSKSALNDSKVHLMTQNSKKYHNI